MPFVTKALNDGDQKKTYRRQAYLYACEAIYACASSYACFLRELSVPCETFSVKTNESRSPAAK